MTRRWLVLVVVLLAAACSDGGDDTQPLDRTSTTSSASSSTSSTTTNTGTSTSTTAGPVNDGDGTLVDTTLRGDEVTVSYQLRLEGPLCFRADIDTSNPTLAATFVDGVEDCLEDPTPLSEPLNATVGALDADQLFGYVWGRATTDVAGLELRFADGSTLAVDLVDTDRGVRAFAIVLDTRNGPAAESLHAVDADGVELANVSVANFLRAGPTYPTVPPSTVPPPTYPTSS